MRKKGSVAVPHESGQQARLEQEHEAHEEDHDVGEVERIIPTRGTTELYEKTKFKAVDVHTEFNPHQMFVWKLVSSVASKIANDMNPKIINSLYIFLTRPCNVKASEMGWLNFSRFTNNAGNESYLEAMFVAFHFQNVQHCDIIGEL